MCIYEGMVRVKYCNFNRTEIYKLLNKLKIFNYLSCFIRTANGNPKKEKWYEKLIYEI
jgi:hypothetical protein